jgi:hypothetical protein
LPRSRSWSNIGHKHSKSYKETKSEVTSGAASERLNSKTPLDVQESSEKKGWTQIGKMPTNVEVCFSPLNSNNF